MATSESTGLAWSAPERLDEDNQDIDRAIREGVPDHIRLRHPHPVWDQREVPSCVSCAVTTAMEVLDARQGRTVRLSPLFNYFLARPNLALSDIEIAQALRSVVDDGVAPLASHPHVFTPEGAQRQPSDLARAKAKEFRLAPQIQWSSFDFKWPYRPVSNSAAVEAWKAPLAVGYPLILGFVIGPNAARLALPGEATLSDLDHNSRGHAVVVIGYDDHALGPNSGAFRIKDSRGPGIGQHGEWWIPYPLVRRGVARELWIVTDISYGA